MTSVDLVRAAREAGTVRKADAGVAGRMAGALARAFYDDPVWVWVVGGRRDRLRLFERTSALFLRRLWPGQDQCYTTERVAGACVWERPGHWQLGVLDQLRLLPRMVGIYGRLTTRVVRSLDALEAGRPEEPHWYLPIVGVAPEWQGRGIGAALMRPVLDRCDEEATAAYLEASTPRNRALYERHGFEVTEEFTLGPGCPPLWRMWRAPGAAS